MDALKKEIKEALLGDLAPTEDGRLAVSFTRFGKYINGLGDGYDKVRIFGVMCKRRWYLSKKNAKQMHELAVRGMQDMGRMMWLSADPEKEAVYCTYLLNTPAILTYSRGKDGVIEAACYSARGLSGWIACFRTLNKFQKKVPEVLQRMSEEDERKKQSDLRAQATEERLAAKQAKKEKKQEKKRLRKENRKARFAKVTGGLPKLPELTPTVNTGSHIPNAEQEGVAPAETGATRNMPEGEFAAETMLARERAAAEDAVVRQQDSGASMDAMRSEQARLEAEAEQAKLAARAAKARLEAAEARLAAEEAEAKLKEIEAKLAFNHRADHPDGKRDDRYQEGINQEDSSLKSGSANSGSIKSGSAKSGSAKSGNGKNRNNKSGNASNGNVNKRNGNYGNSDNGNHGNDNGKK